MTRIVCLSPYVPFERIPHAGGQFLFQYLGRMGTLVDTHLAAPDLERNRLAPADRPAGITTHLVPIAARSRALPARVLRYVRTSADGLTLGIGERQAFRTDPTAMKEVMAADVVEVHWSELLPLVPLVRAWNPTALLVAVEYDVRFQSVSGRARQAALRRDRLLATVAAARVRHREPRLLNRCDAVLTFTAKDVAILRGLGVDTATHVLAPYLTVPEGPVVPAAGSTVLFVAAFDRPENTDGARWFLDHVWPLVRQACPAATVVMAGANPPSWLSARQVEGSVGVPGFVDDLDPLYRSARVVVSPLLSGGGLKFKVPQAMAYGLPVVATTVAADGIVDRSGPNVFAAITDDAEATAAAVIEMLVDQPRAAGIGARAREWALATYRFDESVRGVLTFYDQLRPTSK